MSLDASVGLLLVAAGLLATAAGDLRELRILSGAGHALWNTVGYAATPTTIQIGVWAGFLLCGLGTFLCPAIAEDGLWGERVVPYGPHLLVEKPFAASLAEADRMIAAAAATGKLLAVNWPLARYPSHVASKRLIDEGAIGDAIEIH